MCTNISCSLLGADEIYAEMRDVAGQTCNVRGFECLGACEIAPMASVDGDYVGPLTKEDCRQIVEDLQAGREVLPDKQLKKRKVASEHYK